MHESDKYEFSVEKSKEGISKYTPVLLIAGYVLFFVAALIPFLIKPAFASLFIIAVVIGVPSIPFAWIFIKPEYSYEMASGQAKFKRSFDNRFKKVKLDLHIKDMKEIAPYDEAAKAHLAELGVTKEHLFVSSVNAADQYYMLFEENGQPAVVRFEATTQTVKILRFYNDKTVVTKVNR